MTAPVRNNHLHYDHAGTLVGLPLGELHHIGPRGKDGFSMWFRWGGRIDFTTSDMRRIVREGAEELAKCHFSLADTHDSVGGSE